jgi:hypothetical protein
MKKGLLIIAAVLMLASVAQSGQLKNTCWPCTFTPIKLTSLKVTMDIGYFVRWNNQNGVIKLTQQSDNVTQYKGCASYKVESNFNAQLSFANPAVTPFTDVVDVWQSGPGGTSGSATMGPDQATQGSTMTLAGPTPKGGTPVWVCVTLTNVLLANATPQNNVQVATVTINVVPTAAQSWPTPGGCQ